MYKSLLENCSSRANARIFSPASIRLTIPSLNARLKTRCDDFGLDIRSPMENCPLFSVSHFWGALQHPSALAPNVAITCEFQRVQNGRRLIRFTIVLGDPEFRQECHRKPNVWAVWFDGSPTLEVLLEYFWQAMTDQPIDRIPPLKLWMPADLKLGQRRPAPVFRKG